MQSIFKKTFAFNTKEITKATKTQLITRIILTKKLNSNVKKEINNSLFVAFSTRIKFFLFY